MTEPEPVAPLTAPESFLTLLDDLTGAAAKPSGATAAVLLDHAAGTIRGLLAELDAARSAAVAAASFDTDRSGWDEVLAAGKLITRPPAGHALRPPSWQCLVCDTRYPGRRPEDGICLTCADGTVNPLIGSTVVVCNDDPNPAVGRIVAVYPVEEAADVTWDQSGDGTTTRTPLASLRPFRPRHLSVAEEGET